MMKVFLSSYNTLNFESTPDEKILDTPLAISNSKISLYSFILIYSLCRLWSFFTYKYRNIKKAFRIERAQTLKKYIGILENHSESISFFSILFFSWRDRDKERDSECPDSRNMKINANNCLIFL